MSNENVAEPFRTLLNNFSGQSHLAKSGPDRIDKPSPQVFPIDGFGSLRFVVYDPNRFDVCEDRECKCRLNRNATRGFGATEKEALENFWEQWENA